MRPSLPGALSLPTDWEIHLFGRIVTRSQESGAPHARPLSVFLDEGVVPRDSRDDNFNRLGSDLTKYLLVRKGDLVFNKLRTWQGGFGVSNLEGIVSPAYFVCRPSRSTNPRYLHYLLKSIPYLSELSRISKWMPPSQFDISWDDLRNLAVMLPEARAQRVIAAYLDTETARIDVLVAAKTRMIELLDERSFASLSHILIPDGSQFAHLRYLATIQGGLTVDANRDPGTDAVTLPYLRVANVQAGHLSMVDVTKVTVSRALAARTTLRRNDVLMTEGGDIDKLGRGTVWNGELDPCLHQNHIFAVRPDRRILDPWYLALLTRTVHARRYFESTGVQSTNLASTSSAKIMSFPVPVISLDRQEALVSEWKRREEPTMRMRRTLKAQIELLQERRQSLVTAAATGQLHIPEAA